MITATENRSNAERLKVIIIADGRARRILALAQQIERQVPAAKIYGIVYKIPDASKAPLNLRSIAHSFADWTARLLLGLIHGGRPRTSLGLNRIATSWCVIVSRPAGILCSRTVSSPRKSSIS